MALIGEMQYLTIGDSTYSIPTGGNASFDANLTGSASATTSAGNESLQFTFPNNNEVNFKITVGNEFATKTLPTKTYVENKILEELSNFEHLDYEIVQVLPSVGENGVRYLLYVTDQSTQGYHYEEYLYVENQWIDIGRFDEIDEATETTAGTIKLNPSESINVNANGQLTVGGRLGAFPGTTGIFHSNDREPRAVEDFSFLITDAKGMNLAAPRNLALATGVNLALKGSHAAGSTTYQVSNTYANRIACYVLKNGGYVGQNEAWCKENQIIPVQSVTINGSASWVPDSSADNSANNIVITTETSANPDSAVSQLRIFGSITGGFCSEYIGQCVGGTLGASLEIGQRVYSTSNVNCIVAADTWNSGNGNAIFGRLHISRKNRWFIAGSGHDTTNGRSEAGAVVGQYANITADTMFAVGNGISHTARSNAFEVTSDGGIIVPSSTSGSTKKFKITVDDSGMLTATEVV